MNTKFLHSMLKARRNANRIFTIKDTEGKISTDIEGVTNAFVKYYSNLLGTKAESRRRVCSATLKRGPVISREQRRMLVEEYTSAEMKQALWEIAGDKAPGPDGYVSQFFKDCWEIIREDLEAGVMEFFKIGKLLKAWNSTVLTLVPKSDHAESVVDYRRIACCNTIYKVISKMLTNRLKTVLPSIISPNQSAFVAGRTIAQNILICHDLVRLYNRKQTTSSCLIKIDLRKPYDKVEWEFVAEMIHALEFPQQFIKWTMTCITTVQYEIAINGGLYGNIKGEMGLRQGDPISPLIFVLCMEYFTSKGTFQSVLLLLRGLKTFLECSGLTTNANKSNIFSVNMRSHHQKGLLEITGHQKGNLAFRYLSVPISAKRLSKIDCEILIDKIATRIKGWGTRHLSYARRVQLVNSVLLHIHRYWATIFLIPKQVLKSITAMCRNFILDGKPVTNKPPLVAWDIVCRAKHEGGLGITEMIKWNEAAIAKYVWNIDQKADNLCVKWINNVYLKEMDWWQYKCATDVCWLHSELMEQCQWRVHNTRGIQMENGGAGKLEMEKMGMESHEFTQAQFHLLDYDASKRGATMDEDRHPKDRLSRIMEESDQTNEREKVQGSSHCHTSCFGVLDMESKKHCGMGV
ncbi:PREDICTED: uncharacterized protein LOC109241454 [Nicotiana attenuata]|uniref:uncharacterized protein LOC109241454 n=1 Tax=Nicotiana attenuata TaxID=49451 RepID=UPI000905878D|nr:PREDICTED: uncharacterized protein LOC109241454 [Nicotiana attenuata]